MIRVHNISVYLPKTFESCLFWKERTIFFSYFEESDVEFSRSTDDGDADDDDADTTSDKVSFIESPLVPNTLNSNSNNNDEMNNNNIIDTFSAPAPQSPPPTPQTHSDIELKIENLSNSYIGKDKSNDSDSMNQKRARSTYGDQIVTTTNCC